MQSRTVAAIAQVNGIAPPYRILVGQHLTLPGMAVAVVRVDQTVYAKGFGTRLVGSGTAVDADTVFQLASLSKSVGATVIAHQIGRGAVAWDTPVVQYLPWFALNDDLITRHVTIADMYAHLRLGQNASQRRAGAVRQLASARESGGSAACVKI